MNVIEHKTKYVKLVDDMPYLHANAVWSHHEAWQIFKTAYPNMYIKNMVTKEYDSFQGYTVELTDNEAEEMWYLLKNG